MYLNLLYLKPYYFGIEIRYVIDYFLNIGQHSMFSNIIVKITLLINLEGKISNSRI